MILRCTCRSEYQDKLYGLAMRVHNKTNKSDGAVQRCTVCGSEQTSSPKGKVSVSKGKKS